MCYSCNLQKEVYIKRKENQFRAPEMHMPVIEINLNDLVYSTSTTSGYHTQPIMKIRQLFTLSLQAGSPYGLFRDLL